MKWFRIPKENSVKPAKGGYSDWKEPLSIEGREQCVYCSININSFGGIRNFHVEHYKPKAEGKFPELKDEYSNLFFACAICNCFKSDDWENEPSEKLDNHAYPDPAKVDYSDFLFQDALHLVDSNHITGKYIVQKLFLNRPQLILERKSFDLHSRLKDETQKLTHILLQIKKQDINNPLIDGYITMAETILILIEGNYINPYTTAQTKR